MGEQPSADAERRFEEVFHSCWLATFRFALAWTNDWPAAEDIAQDAFTRLWARRDSIDWSEPMLPWLLQVTRRLANDRFRRMRRAIRLPLGSTPGSLDGDARLRWLDVQAAMATLTQVQRAALVLVTVVGVDYETAARALGTTPGALRAAVSRARATLQDA